VSVNQPIEISERSRDSEVGIVIGYGLDGRGVGVPSPVGVRFFPLHVVQPGSGVNPASYPLGTWGSFPGGKAVEARSWAHLQLVPRSRICWSIHPFPHTSSWRSAQLSTETTLQKYVKYVILTGWWYSTCNMFVRNAMNIWKECHLYELWSLSFIFFTVGVNSSKRKWTN
jgi:hypothetical protein